MTMSLLLLAAALVSQHDHGQMGGMKGMNPDGGAPEISLTPEAARAVGIQSELPTDQDFARVIRAVASVSADERRLAHIHTKVSGYIEKLYVDYVGRNVKKGDRLMDLYSAEVLAAQNEWLTALKQVEDARKRSASDSEVQSRNALATAARKRLKLWDIDDRVLDEIQRERQPRRTITFYSPLSGTVIVKEAVQGLFVGPDVHLFAIADLTKVWIVADVYAQEMEDLHTGMPATVTVEGVSAERSGVIDFISPTVQASTRTITVRMTLDNAGASLKPGAYGTLSITVPGRKALAVSDQSVLLTGDRAVLFVQTSDGKFQARDVKIGRRIPGFFEIKSGLKADERVVVKGQFVLDAETQLRGGGSGHAGHGG